MAQKKTFMVDMTPAAFSADNPNREKNVAKANKASRDMENAISGKAHTATEIFRELAAMSGKPTFTEQLADTLFNAAKRTGYTREEYDGLREKCQDWAERWAVLDEMHDKAGTDIRDALVGV